MEGIFGGRGGGWRGFLGGEEGGGGDFWWFLSGLEMFLGRFLIFLKDFLNFFSVTFG